MLKLGPHVAAVGMTFYTGTMFPASYKNAAIIALHGSWNRSIPSGYRVMVAHTDGVASPATSPSSKLPPWHQIRQCPGRMGAGKAALGRPADVLQMPT